jgi:hypothetical protein
MMIKMFQEKEIYRIYRKYLYFFILKALFLNFEYCYYEVFRIFNFIIIINIWIKYYGM